MDVVVVASASDPEAQAVLDAGEAAGLRVIRFNLDDLRATRQRSVAGALDLLVDGMWWRVSAATSVWWHRAGVVNTEGLAPDEAQLVADEGPHLLRGAFAGAFVRWVDEPFAVERAETKLHQLAVASTTTAPWGRIEIPESLVTNAAAEARRFADGRRVVAKPLSPGIGIAPFVAEVSPADLNAVDGNPVLLQALVAAQADLRVVVVGHDAWVWSRRREPTTVDWRADDPVGAAFAPVPNDDLRAAAVRITSALGLTMSVQDWLATDGDPVFLEANPQGGWLFLAGAGEAVVPAIVAHLAQAQESDGQWPSALRRFGWDLGRAETAPENDGVVAPVYAEPLWIDDVAAHPGALDAARRAHDAAEESAKRAEEKAGRLVPAALALLTVTIAVGTFQLDFALRRGWPWLLTTVPCAAAIVFLALAAFESLEIDRVGVYGCVSAGDLAAIGPRDPAAVLLAREEDGRRLAAWTAVHKHTDLMQARAWFSRAVAALLLAGLVAGSCQAGTTSTSHPPATRTTKPVTTTTTTKPTTTTMITATTTTPRR